ncbi:unnamed protein product [Microthlaspi erraticum]|uniref:Retrotransposon gag domain-containing protein n=1 Tax=Microthlaspi erraticum TaxID=1685480 RepID=A0A6D2LH68_9BRAS|nr:unnamed protein product [Microthlaspi erraticum]
MKIRQVPLTEQPRPAHFRRLTTKLERVNRRLDEVDSKVHRATSSAPELTKALADTRRSPLTRRLRQIELHERVRLKIDSYTGEEDPKKWLTAFNLAMRREKYKSYDEREANYCQVFVEHMAKDALTWFSNLPAESIDNFDDLTNAFLKHYSMHMTRITRNMFTTTQTQGEPLRSFMERFKQANTGDMPDSVPRPGSTPQRPLVRLQVQGGFVTKTPCDSGGRVPPLSELHLPRGRPALLRRETWR